MKYFILFVFVCLVGSSTASLAQNLPAYLTVTDLRNKLLKISTALTSDFQSLKGSEYERSLFGISYHGTLHFLPGDEPIATDSDGAYSARYEVSLCNAATQAEIDVPYKRWVALIDEVLSDYYSLKVSAGNQGNVSKIFFSTATKPLRIEIKKVQGANDWRVSIVISLADELDTGIINYAKKNKEKTNEDANASLSYDEINALLFDSINQKQNKNNTIPVDTDVSQSTSLKSTPENASLSHNGKKPKYPEVPELRASLLQILSAIKNKTIAQDELQVDKKKKIEYYKPNYHLFEGDKAIFTLYKTLRVVLLEKNSRAIAEDGVLYWSHLVEKALPEFEMPYPGTFISTEQPIMEIRIYRDKMSYTEDRVLIDVGFLSEDLKFTLQRDKEEYADKREVEVLKTGRLMDEDGVARPKEGFTGKGRFLWPDSTYYKGEWKNGVPDGFGLFIYYKKNEYFLGDVKNGKCTGSVLYYWESLGNSYDGYMVDGVMHGEGTYTIHQGTTGETVITGKFSNGYAVSGQTKTTYPNANKTADRPASNYNSNQYNSGEPKTCSKCSGKGAIEVQKVCMSCYGKGTSGTRVTYGTSHTGQREERVVATGCPYCKGGFNIVFKGCTDCKGTGKTN